jgi:hypothetical protein
MAGTLGVLAACPAATTTKVEALRVGPWGVLAACPTAATTEVEDVIGGPIGGCWRQVRQWPPLKLKTSMAGPLEVLAVGPAATTTEAKDVDGGPPGGGRAGNPGAPTTNAKKRRRWAPERCRS